MAVDEELKGKQRKIHADIAADLFVRLGIARDPAIKQTALAIADLYIETLQMKKQAMHADFAGIGKYNTQERTIKQAREAWFASPEGAENGLRVAQIESALVDISAHGARQLQNHPDTLDAYMPFLEEKDRREMNNPPAERIYTPGDAGSRQRAAEKIVGTIVKHCISTMPQLKQDLRTGGDKQDVPLAFDNTEHQREVASRWAQAVKARLRFIPDSGVKK